MAVNPEYSFDMLMVLGECQQNYSAAERVYNERYPDRPSASRKVFKRLADRIKRGKVMPTHNKQEKIFRPTRNEENAVNVLAAININPNQSIRDISRDSGLSTASVWRILEDAEFHPYHLELHQALSEADKEKRSQFCQWAQAQIQDDPHFFNRVLWSDEATFKSNGDVNTHNCHYWASENPHWMQQVDDQHVWKINVWCGIVGNHIIGPYFFEGTVNGKTYLHLLQNELPQRSSSMMYLLTFVGTWFSNRMELQPTSP